MQSMFCHLFSLFTFEFNYVLSFLGSACYYAEVNKIDRPNTTPTVRVICTLDLPFIFRSFDLFVASLLFMKGISYCLIRRKLEPLHVIGIGLHDFRALLSACCFVEFDTSIICNALVYCLGSFLLQDLFLSLQVFAFEGQNMTFTVNVLLTRRHVCVPPRGTNSADWTRRSDRESRGRF